MNDPNTEKDYELQGDQSSLDMDGSQNTKGSSSIPEAQKPFPNRSKLYLSHTMVTKVVLVLVILVLVVCAYGGIYFYQNVNGSVGGSQVVVLVPVGDNLDSLAVTLSRQGVISSPIVFRIYLRLHGYPELQPGIYYFKKREPYARIFAQIRSGPSSVRLTIVPGWNLSEIASQVAKMPYHNAKAFLKAASSTGSLNSPFIPPTAPNVEGFVFPDTYFVSPLESDRQILQTAIDRFDQVASQVGLSPRGTYNGLSSYQTVVAASIVQKEATTVPDMAKVARVILNRLAAGMNLQMDSTVRYATGNYSGALTIGNLHSPSPYNTYASQGLPPSPISEPSIQAIQAVMHPQSGSWLYFVALKGHSSESFFNTYAEQERAISQAGGVS